MKRFSVYGTAVLAVLTALSLAAISARAEDSSLDAANGDPTISTDADTAPQASGLTTLYRFTGGKNGRWPRGGVILHDGAIYGTTLYDGACSTCGIVYKLTGKNTSWKLSVVHSFKLGSDGIGPQAPLSISGDTLFGTTFAGADPKCGCGEVFDVKLPSSYKILNRFNRTNGEGPVGGVLIAKDGTMYGGASLGGKHQGGVVYKITKGGSFSVLYNLTSNTGASGPFGELIIGKDGAIYGTTYGNGKYNQGMVFRLTTGGSFTDIYDFKGVNQPGGSSDGAQPEGRLALGKDGTIYGTTTFGGSPSGYGTAWSLTPQSGGKFAYAQLAIFGSDGNLPHSGLVIDSDGVLYGTGAGGGDFQGGVIYSLTEATPGNWNYALLHSFKEMDPNGDTPYADLWFADGVLYGTTLSGGHIGGSDCEIGCGTVFKFVP